MSGKPQPDPPSSSSIIIVWSIFCILGGGWLWNSVILDPQVITKTNTKTEVIHAEPEVITKTETVTKTNTVTVTELPDACADALSSAYDQGKTALRLDESSTQLLDFLSEARQAVLMSDMNKLNDIETELRQIQEATLGNVEHLSTNGTNLTDLTKECESNR